MARTVTRYKDVPPFLRSAANAIRHGEKNVPNEDWDDPDAREVLENRAWLYSAFAQKSYQEGEIRVHRSVVVPVVDGKAEINFDCAGKSWSKTRSGVGSYNSPGPAEGEREIVISGFVKPQNVDWFWGLDSFFMYGEDQWEVSMIENSPVLITHVDDVQLPEAIEANTGPAGEYWFDQCGKGKRS